MVPPPDPFPMEALLAEAGWLSALARRLVGDPNTADDVVQDTFLSALSAPPRTDRPLRPWLASVARNVARMRIRSEKSRKTRESARIDLRESLSADDLAEKLESQRLLVDALRELDEPYRSTILLHYFEHLDSAEIARRHGVAPGTVRWRLKVGVDALRARLDDRHHGDRAAWCVLLMPLASRPNAAASSTVFAEVLGMNLGLKLGAGIVLAGAIFLGVRSSIAWIRGDGSSFVSSSRWTAMQERVGVEFRPLDRALAEPETTARTTIASTSVEPAATAASTRVEARILDANGAPIPGISLVAENLGRRTVATSDAAGRIGSDLPLPFQSGSVSFQAGAPGRATRFVSASVARGKTTYLGDLVLGPGGAISGRVVDEKNEPIAGATIAVDALDIPQSELDRRVEIAWFSHGDPSTASRPDGSFRLEGVPAGSARIVASTLDRIPCFSGIIEVRSAQESAGVVLRLDPIPRDRMLVGVVLDPEGEPVPYVHVQYREKSARGGGSGSFNSDGHGRFRKLVDPGSRTELLAHDARFGDAELKDVDAKDGEVVLRFPPARRLEIEVRDAQGAPVTSFALCFMRPDHDGAFGSEPDGVHVDGKASMLVPPSAFLVQVIAKGHHIAEIGPFDPAGVGERIAVVLRSIPGLRGRVLAAGAPIAGARVLLFRDRDQRITHDGFRVFRDPTAVDETTSGVDGGFVSTARDSGIMWVRAESSGFAATELGPLDVDAERGLDGLELALSAGGTIEGRVLAAAGREPAGVVVAISRGDGFPRSQRVGPEGTFRFERLIPGRWIVKQVDDDIDEASGSTSFYEGGHWNEIPSNCLVEEGRSTRFDLDLAQATARGTVRGRVTVDGAAPGAWSAELTRLDAADMFANGARVPLDADGSFRIATDELGPHRLVLTALGGEFDGLRLIETISLVPGEVRWERDTRTARLHVEGSRGARGDLAWVVAGANGDLALRPVPGGSEPIDLVVPSGAGRLVRLTNDLQGRDPSTWPALVELMLAPGESKSVTLR